VRRGLDAFVGGAIGRRGDAEIDRDPAKEPAVLGAVRAQELREGLGGDCGNLAPGDRGRVCRDIVMATVARRDRDQQYSLIRIDDTNRRSIRDAHPAAGEHGDASLEFQGPCDAPLSRADAA
jgi:hypothetical protein